MPAAEVVTWAMIDRTKERTRKSRGKCVKGLDKGVCDCGVHVKCVEQVEYTVCAECTVVVVS